MGYIFLFISLAFGAAKGYCAKKTSGHVTGYRGSVFANMIRMLLCSAIGLVLIVFGNGLTDLALTPQALLICLLSGISISAMVITWMICVKKSAYMMLDVFLLLGTLVPLILSRILYSEQIQLTQALGFCVLLIAVFFMCSYSSSIKEKISKKDLLLLILCGLSSGLTDFTQKMFVKQLPQTLISVFNFYTYVISSVILIVVFIVLTKKKNAQTKEEANLKNIFGYVLVMAIALFGHSYFRTAAAAHLDAAQLYPISQGFGLILATIMSAVFFHEKPTKKCIIGLILTFSALLIMRM